MTRSVRVGFFVVATLAILWAGIFLIGNRKLRFRSTYPIHTQFQNVAGLQGGADVRVGGVHMGTVKRIDLPKRPGGEVTVVLDLERQTRGVLNRGSIASIQSEGLLGDKFVEVSFGEPGAAELQDGDTIRSQPPIDIPDLIKKANQILGATDEAVRNVDGTARNLQAVTSRINDGKGTVGALIDDQALYQRANAGVAAFQEDMEALKHNFLLRGFFKQRGYEDQTELAKHLISRLPAAPPWKEYSYDAAKIFDKGDSAKIRNAKALNEAGQFLQDNPFGLAVVAVSTGATGETDKSLTLSQARGMVVREYLADHFRFDDSRLKTLALGKTGQPGDRAKVEILAYPSATTLTAGRGGR